MKAKFIVLGLLGILVALSLTACEDLEAMVQDPVSNLATNLQGTPAQTPPGTVVTGTQTTTPGAEITSTLPISPGLGLTTTRTITPGTTIQPTGTVTVGQGTPQPPATTLDPDSLESLDQFPSYRMSTLVTFQPDEGQRIVFEVLTESVSQSGNQAMGQQVLRHWVITLTQGLEQLGTVEFVTNDSQSWVRVNDDWAQTQVTPSQLLGEIGWAGDPEDFLTDDAEGTFVREQTIGGMTTWMYRFGCSDLTETAGFIDVETAEAAMWVSPTYWVPIRTYLRAIGNAPRFGMGLLESISTVSAISETISFTVPPELMPGGTTTPMAGQTITPGQTPSVTQTLGAGLTPTVMQTPGAGVTPTVTRTPGAGQTPMVTATMGADLTPTTGLMPTSSVQATLTQGTPAAGTQEPDMMARFNLPLIQGASNIRRVANMILYEVNQSPTSVIDFYANLAESTGWRIAEGEAAGETTITLIRENVSANIVAISRQGTDQTTVIVNIEEQ